MLHTDIETLPAVHMNADQRALFLWDKIPKNISKPETINKWLNEEGDEEFRKTSLNWRHGWIACAVIAFKDEEPVLFSPRDPSLRGEATLFAGMYLYLQDLSERYPSDFARTIEWCGWNISGFDMPWLHHAALRARARKICRTINPRPREKFKQPWVDLMNIWSLHQYGARASAKDVAEYLGIPELAPDSDGSMVYDQYLAGDWDSIEQHCLSDVDRDRKIARLLGVT